MKVRAICHISCLLLTIFNHFSVQFSLQFLLSLYKPGGIPPFLELLRLPIARSLAEEDGALHRLSLPVNVIKITLFKPLCFVIKHTWILVSSPLPGLSSYIHRHLYDHRCFLFQEQKEVEKQLVFQTALLGSAKSVSSCSDVWNTSA